MHIIEKIITGLVWIICFISIWFIPKKRYRHASFIFLFTQLPSWILGLTVVQAGWIEYPIREFHEVNATSFTFEYLVLPILCIFFNIHYPNAKNIQKRIFYFTTFISIFTLIEYFTEKYTLIIKYMHWHWYWTWISMFIVVYFVRVIYKWFFRINKPFAL